MSQPVKYEYDVFWSHSGEQKPFVEELNVQLKSKAKSARNNFLDSHYNSLPVAQNYPDNIARAIASCRVAVLLISPSFLEKSWPMKELSDLVEGGTALILPVFYGVRPGELTGPDMQARFRKLMQRHSFITPDMLDKWETALRSTTVNNGRNLSSGTVDVNSAPVRRLLSDIRLLVATHVIREANVEDEKRLKVACQDIDDELETKEGMAESEISESAALLVKSDVIPDLVRLMRVLPDKKSRVMEAAAWALDNILYKADGLRAAGVTQAAEAGAVEALVDMLMMGATDRETAPVFCLRNIVGTSGRFASTLVAKDQADGGTFLRRLAQVLVRHKHEQECINACIGILEKLIFL